MSSVTLDLTDLPFTETDLTASVCRASFERFVREFWHEVPGTEPLKWNWHMSLLCRETQYVCERVFKRLPKEHDLLINVPFGTSKSSLLMILRPAWIWTRMPEARFISATHTQDLGIDFADKFSEVVKCERYRQLFPDIYFSKDADSHLKNNHGGDRLVATIGGKTPTGFHAHFLDVDDPLDPQGARSDAELETAAKFMTETLPSRVVDKEVSVTTLIMQRLHYRDPSYVVLEVAKHAGSIFVRHVCLPGELADNVSPPLAELRQDYPEAYQEDDLLDPVRLSRRVLVRYRNTLGAYGYAGQVMQQPSLPGGGMFRAEYFSKRVKAAPYQAKRIRGWDRAACLIAGTMVRTERGDVAIEDVTSDDRVLTRKGFRRVVWSGVSGYVDELSCVRFANGSTLVGTTDHPVWTENRGWVELAYLVEQDLCWSTSGAVSPIEPSVTRTAQTDKVADVNNASAPRRSGVPVYDLQVDGDHEFFANGILVHNTDQGGCATAGVLMARDDQGNFYVEDCVWGQWEPFERNEKIVATAIRDRARYGPTYEPRIVIEQEGGSTGEESYRRLASQLSGFRVSSERPTGSKDVRAEPWSAQCAARNVYLVDNGESQGTGRSTWDVEGFVREHTLFKPEAGKRLGGWKDRVDASSMSFNLLAGVKSGYGMKVLTLGRNDKLKGPRLVACSKENLARTVLNEKALLVVIRDPTPAIKEEVRSNGHVRNGLVELPPDTPPPSDLPPHGLNRLLGHCVVEFCDLSSDEMQDRWHDPVPPWDLAPEVLVMQREHAKKVWSTLLKKRDPFAEVYVFVDDGDRRALSICYAVCDTLRSNRAAILLAGSEEMAHAGGAPNKHVYEMTKLGRGLVV